MAHKIEDIEGIGPVLAQKLAVAKIKTTDDLLKLCSNETGRKEIATLTGVDQTKLLKWANMADLMRIKGIGGEYAELLEAAGVDTVKELQARTPDSLADKMKQINEVKNLTRTVPSSSKIGDWIEQAKQTKSMIAR